MFRLTKSIAISVSVLFLSACALAPGMRVGDLPPTGQIVTESGLNLQVETITAKTLPDSKPATIVADAQTLFKQNSHPTYLLASGDILGINLWANPELTSSTVSAQGFMIDQAGYITFPLIGRIKAADSSLESFSAKLQKRLSAYLKQPDAQVTVLAYGGRKFYVDGAVKTPGQFPISNQAQTLYSALSSAGGALETGDINNILFTRNGKGYTLGLLDLQRANLSPDKIFLKEGDSIHVYSKENRKLYLLGEAGSPNALSIPEQGLSLANVVGLGRGLTLSSNAAQVYVVRDNSKNHLTHIYHIDLSNVSNLALADRFKMQANDIVYVDASGLVRWNRVLTLLLPSTQGLGTIASTGSYYK